MPGLLRGVARTAAIAGTATAVSNRVSRRQASRWQQQGYDQGGGDPGGGYAQEPPPPPAAPPVDPIAQLRDLAALKEQGVLTDEEFAVQKAKLLRM
jgi:hypothetical protein